MIERTARNLRAALGGIHPILAGEAFWQLVRFAVAGLGVTFFSVLVYSTAAVLLRVPPLGANTISWLCGVTAGYAVHSRWSFAAAREEGEGGMVIRFLMASGLAFALNSLWVWLATGLFRLPPLAPVPMMMFVTPLASFLLNRYWVFEAA
ncbi:MAG TPA: GtrA family protein [Allosphingosinicella sp.]|jgi:putative flippase GtrA